MSLHLLARLHPIYFRIKRYTFSPTTTFDKWRYDPLSAINSPPKEKYAVL